MVIDTSISAVNQTGATCSGLLLDNFSLQPVKLNEVQHTGAAGGCNAPDHHQAAPVAPIAPDHHQAAKCTKMHHLHQLHQPDAPDHHLHQNPWQEFHLAKRTQGPLSTAT